jgi:hypothetical protein
VFGFWFLKSRHGVPPRSQRADVILQSAYDIALMAPSGDSFVTWVASGLR